MNDLGQGDAGLAPGERYLQSLSDVALTGKINRLIELRHLDRKGEKELADLQNERRRRREKRRGEEGA